MRRPVNLDVFRGIIRLHVGSCEIVFFCFGLNLLAMLKVNLDVSEVLHSPVGLLLF